MLKRQIVLILFIVNAAIAQPDILWNRYYGGEGAQECRSAIITSDGGFLLGGKDGSPPGPRDDILILKMSQDGDSLWAYSFGGIRHESLFEVVELEDTCFALIGDTESYGHGSFDAWVVKISPDGERIWDRCYGGESADGAYAGISTEDGGFALAGYTHSFAEHGSWDAWLVKVDADGEVEWQGIYGGEGSDEFNSIVTTSDGGYAMAGTTRSFGEGGLDFYIVKTDEDGEMQWSHAYGSERSDGCYAIVQTDDDGFVLGGVNSGEDNDGDMYLVRIDSEGEVIWDRTYGLRGPDICFSLIQTGEGGFIAGGEVSRDFYIVRVDRYGELIWSEIYGGDGGERCYEVLATDNGGYAFAGYTNSFDAFWVDFWLIKTGPDIIRWLSIPDSGFIENGSLSYDIAYFNNYITPEVYLDSVLVFTVDNGEHIFGEIANDTLTITSEEDWIGLDSLLLVVIEEDDEENCDSTWLRLTVQEDNNISAALDQGIPKSIVLYDAYPNPFNSVMDISYSIPHLAQVSLQVFDISGRLVTTLVDEEQTAGYHRTIWEGYSASTGVYFVRMASADFVAVRKVVLVK